MPTERSKELGTNKNSRSVLLLVSHIASTRSNIACHFNPICLEQGAAKLATRGCIREITPTLRSDNLAQWPALNRDLRSFFDSAVLFNITFANGKPRIITVSQTVPVWFWNYTCTRKKMVII